MMLRNLLKSVAMFAVLGIIAPSFSLAAPPSIDQRPQWQYYKDINISGNPAKGDLVKITLDQDVFNNSKNDLSDLRLIDKGGNEVPYKLIIERGAFSQENIYPVLVLNNSYSAEGGYNIFIVDFGQSGFLSSSLNIITNSENFKRTVEIAGSNDMTSWNILKSNGYIYDYTDKAVDFKAQNTKIDYPENAFRYIQVKIFVNDGAPLVVNGVQVSKIKKSESRETVLNPKYEVRENSVRRITEVIIDLGKKGWPTGNITITSPDENFNRETAVYESSDKVIWRRVGESHIFNYNTPKFTGANLEVNYSETGGQYLKIEIFNGDNSPISINSVSVKTILRSIAFQYGTGAAGFSYKLYYGNPKANFPEYDLEKFFPYLDTGVYFGAVLSEGRINPFYQKEIPPSLPISERIPYLVPGALIFAILMMGFMVLRFMKKVGVDKK